MDSGERRAEREKERQHELARHQRLVALVREDTKLYRRVLERYSPLVAERARLTAAAMAYASTGDDWRAPKLYRRLRELPLSIPWGLSLDRRTLEVVAGDHPRAVRVLPPRGANEDFDEDETIAALFALDRGLEGRSRRSAAAHGGVLAAATVAAEALRCTKTPDALAKQLKRTREGEPVSAYDRWCAAVQGLRSRSTYLEERRLAEIEQLCRLHRIDRQ